MNPEDVADVFEKQYVRPKPGRTLIVGSQVYKTREDRRARYPDVLGVDMLDGPGVDRVVDMERVLPADLGLFAHIECRSVLEHSRKPWLLAANVERLMDQGGTIHLAVPFVWGIHSYPSDYFRFTAEGIRELFPQIEWQALMYAGRAITEGGKTPRVNIAGHTYVERTEVMGFGIRR